MVISLWPIITLLFRICATLFALLLARLAYLFYLGKKPLDPRLKIFPVPSGELPILGHAHLANFGELVLIAGKYGPVHLLKNFTDTWIVVNTPELCHAVMAHPNSIRNNWINDMEGDIFGFGVFASEGAAWSHPRSVLSTVVTREALGNLCPLIVRKADILLAKWFQNGTRKESTIKVDAEMVALTIDVIGEVILGEDLRVCDGDPWHFHKHYNTMAREWMLRIMMYKFIPLCPRLPFWNNVKTWYARRSAEAVLRKAYHKRRALLAQDPELRACMMDALIKADYTADDCLRELTGMIFAGHDTTAHTIAFATYELSRNPDALVKLRKEAKEVLDGVPAEKVTLSHVAQLAYAHQIVRETLRVYPIANAVLRTFTEDTTISGYLFPRGYQVFCHIHAVQYDPRIYPEPEKWRPERFAEADIPPTSWIPFASGAHVCLGQNVAMLEAKLALAHLSLKANFAADEKYKLTPWQSPTLAPAERLPMRVTPVASAAN